VLPRVLADGSWRGELDLRADAAGATVPVEASITAVLASGGQRHCFLVALHDLRAPRQTEARLQRMAMVDELTGLPNRLAAQLLKPAALSRADARSLVRAQSQSLLERVTAAARRSALSSQARAHLEDSADTLRQALTAKLPRAGA
jgi:hypothetical protein